MKDDIELFKQKYSEYVSKHETEVSVFLRTFNRVEYLKLAIDSLLQGIFKDFCLIILDNGSTDSTAHCCRQYSSLYDNIFYCYRLSEKKYTNVQFAIAECRTEYIILLHDDDVLESNYLDVVLSEIKRNNSTAISCSSHLIDENGEKLKSSQKELNEPVFFKNNEYLLNYFVPGRKLMNYPSTIYNTSFLKNHPIVFQPDAGPCLDDFLFFQICRYGGTIELLPQKLINYRIHQGQDSFNSKRFMVLKLLDYMLKDDYYSSIVMQEKSFLYREVWKAFRYSFTSYNSHKITKTAYEELFSYQVVMILKHSFFGLCLYVLMQLVFTLNPFFKILVNCKNCILHRTIRKTNTKDS